MEKATQCSRSMDPARAAGSHFEGWTADPNGSGASLAHSIDAFREGVARKHPGGCAVPKLHRRVDVSLETSLVHRFQGGFEAWLPAIMVKQAIALGTQEGDRGGGEPIVTSFQHLGDRLESSVEIFKSEVIPFGRAEEGEDQQPIEVELEHVGLSVLSSVD